VRVRAASLCHTDLEVIEGSLAVALPAVLGYEAADEVSEFALSVIGLTHQSVIKATKDLTLRRQ
jgi:S-(hydroxymethyl)glutathione dehydrogenase / alcohol dehydrogenase